MDFFLLNGLKKDEEIAHLYALLWSLSWVCLFGYDSRVDAEILMKYSSVLLSTVA